ncbi:MAG: hypothetical protein ABSB82_17070 [Terriglobia bacterium]|jgi:hypothetical protein
MDLENRVNKFRLEMKENIVRDLRDGKLTLQAVAVKNQTTISTVYQIARKNGLRRKDREAGRCTAPPATADQTKGEK